MRTLRILVLIMIAALVALFFVVTLNRDPQQLLLDQIAAWDARMIWIIALISGLILLSTFSGLPVLYLSVAFGFFLPYIPAIALSWVMNLLAVMATWFMVNRLYSAYFKKRYGNRKIIQRVNRKIKKYGMWTVAFSRGIYVIPTNIINFSFPLSKINLRQYFYGTMLGLVPETLLNVTTGYLLRHQLELLQSPEPNLVKAVLIGAGILLITATFLAVRYLRQRGRTRRLNQVVPKFRDAD